MFTKNPFNQNEDWQIWFKYDPKFRLHQRVYLNSYLKNNYTVLQQPNIFITLKQFLTANVTATIVCSIFILGSISASVAQNLAPQNYKPSEILNKLFSTNK